MTIVTIDTEFIRLDAMLKLGGARDSGGQAKFAIQSGLVKVNGEFCTQNKKKMRQGDTAEMNGRTYQVQVEEPEA